MQSGKSDMLGVEKIKSTRAHAFQRAAAPDC